MSTWTITVEGEDLIALEEAAMESARRFFGVYFNEAKWDDEATGWRPMSLRDMDFTVTSDTYTSRTVDGVISHDVLSYKAKVLVTW